MAPGDHLRNRLAGIRSKEADDAILMPAQNALSHKKGTTAKWFRRYCDYVWALVLLALVVVLLVLLLPEENGRSISQYLPRMPSSSRLPTFTSSHHVAHGVSFPCPKVHSDADSAVERAITDECKQEIAAAACKNEAKQLHPAKLSNLCPKRVIQEDKGKYLGCYKDSFDERIFSGVVHKLKNSNSVENCLNLCFEAGYSYAGLQYTVECFCANEDPSAERKADSEEACDAVCPGNAAQRCGGYLTMNVFHTGVYQIPRDESSGGDSEGGGQARIVYLLTVTGRSVRQVRRLVKLIYDSRNYLLIHVDSRQDFMHRELSVLEKRFPSNVRMVRHRFATIWGGASLLQMLLQSMRELLELSDWKWDFVLNLSESDFPLKHPDKLVEFLSGKQGKNFVKTHGRDTSDFVRKQGLDRAFYECENHMWRLGKRKLPLGVQIDGGSDWICLHREFVRYIVHEEDGLISGLREYFRYALLPGESFFHTALMNSPFCSTVVNNNLHLTNWKRKQGCKCQHRAAVDWCGCSPNDFTVEDGKKINATRKKETFFGRKFEASVDQRIIAEVEERMLGIEPRPDLHGRDSYWENIFHHLDETPKVKPEKLTVAAVLARKHLEDISTNLVLNRILEMTLYNQADEMAGMLLLYEAVAEVKSGEPPAQIEVLTVPTGFSTADTGSVSCAVGSEFDPKELFFRNKLGAIGPSTEITVMCTLSESESVWPTVEIVLFNPYGELTHVAEVSFENETKTDSFKLVDLSKPMLPGEWTVAILSAIDGDENFALGKTAFVVMPILPEFADLTQEELKSLHSGSPINHTWTKDYSALFHAVFPDESSTDALRDALAKKESRMSGGDAILNWIKDLSKDRFEIRQSCLADGSIKGNGGDVILPQCESTAWSSLSPDPKSSIDGLDERTGRLV